MEKRLDKLDDVEKKVCNLDKESNKIWTAIKDKIRKSISKKIIF